jgi:hypothetical protein
MSIRMLGVILVVVSTVIAIAVSLAISRLRGGDPPDGANPAVLSDVNGKVVILSKRRVLPRLRC